MSFDTGFRYKGVGGLGASLMAGRIAQAISFLLMARFLSKSDMGKVALFTAIFLGFFQLTNLGFDRYVIYASARDRDELHQTIDAVWTLQLIRGTLVLLSTFPAYLLLRLFPQIGIGLGEVMAIGAIVFLFSLANPELSSFERGGNFVFVSRARGLSVIAGSLFTIALVTVWRTPWVYLAGQVANALVLIGFSHYYSSRAPSIKFDLDRMKSVIQYSRHLIMISIVSFVSSQAQNIYVDALFGSAILGMYFTWYRLVSLPGEFVTQMQDRLLFAKASEQARRRQHNGRAQIIGFGLSMGLLVPFYIFVWFHGDVLMQVLAGTRWIPFWWVGRMFVFVSFLLAVSGTMTPFMLVTIPHWASRLRTAEVLLGLGLMTILGTRFGVGGIAAALLTEILVATVMRLVLLYRYVITERRLVHIGMALFILVAVAGPLLSWEWIGARVLTSRPLAFASVGFSTAWMLALSLSVYLGRHRLQAQLRL